jgi:hypothetical protein
LKKDYQALIILFCFNAVATRKTDEMKDHMILLWGILISGLSPTKRKPKFVYLVLQPDRLLLFPFSWKK